jgi:histidinol phosphatase-like enzyme
MTPACNPEWNSPRDPARWHAIDPAPSSMLRPALFIDLAGVLLDAPPRCAPSTGRLPGLRGGVGAALRLLERLDYRIVVLAPCALDRRRASHVLPARICDLLARERVTLAACCCCDATHAPCKACPPAPALLLRAAHDFDLALNASWVLARDADFITAGRRAGCRTLQVGGGGGDDAWPAPVPPCSGAHGTAAYQARDIVDAALAIVRLDGA